MKRTVAHDIWAMLEQAGVRRVYGIVGDALNPTLDAIKDFPDLEFIHVRHEEWGAFAASGEAQATGEPVVVVGTAGPGVTHLINGLQDAKHEYAPVIGLAGDVETSIMDTDGLEEVSPYDLFRTCSHYIGRVVDAQQARAVTQQAIQVAVEERGPTVIGLPPNIAQTPSPLSEAPTLGLTASPTVVPDETSVDAAVDVLREAQNVMIFGGAGCAKAGSMVRDLAGHLQAPVGFTLKGKNWLERDNRFAVGLTGLLGYGGCHEGIKKADVVLMLGTDFPYPDFLKVGHAKHIQVDIRPLHLGRRVEPDVAVAGDVGVFISQLMDRLPAREDPSFLDEILKADARARKSLDAYVKDGAQNSPIRPEYVASTLNTLLANDAVVTADTGTAVIWAAHHLEFGGGRKLLGSLSWASMAPASPQAFGAWKADPQRQTVALCGDGGFSMLALADLWTEACHRANVVHVVLNNGMLDFVDIEQQEAGLVPYGTDMPNPNWAAVAETLGATGIRIEDPAELKPKLREALDHQGGPVVVDVLVDPDALALPPGVPGGTVLGFAKSLAKQAFSGDIDDVVREGIRNIRLL